MNSMLELTIYIKMSFNGNRHKTKLQFDQLMEILWPEAHRSLTVSFHKSQRSVSANFVFAEHNHYSA